MDQIKLLSSLFTRLVIDKVSKLRKNIGSNLNHHLVQRGHLENIEHLESCILLNRNIRISLSEASNYLGNSEPDVFTNIVTSELNQLYDDIKVPIKVLSKFFGKNGNFQDHFFLEFIVILLEIVKKLVDNFTSRLLITKTKEQVKCPSSNIDVRISKTHKYLLKVLLHQEGAHLYTL